MSKKRKEGILSIAFVGFLLSLVSVQCKKLPYIPDENAVIYIKSLPTRIGNLEHATIFLQGEKGNGYPLPDETVVYLSVTHGRLDAEVVLVDGRGQAEYYPESGFSGQAEITARCGQATISPETLVVTVSDRDIKKLLIRADPAQLPFGGGRSSIEVQAIDELMLPVPGKNVWLESDQGTLNPGGFLTTDDSGRIHSRLTTEKAAKVKASYKEISAEADVTIDDKNTPPVADFAFSPLQPRSGEPVYFNASTSHDDDGWIVSYEWDFGDGSTGTGMTISHAYDVKVSVKFSVVLRVRDNLGGEGAKVREVEVLP